MTDLGVRVIRPFAQFSTGFVMYPSAIYRAALLRNRWVEEVKPEDAKPLTPTPPVKSTNQNKQTLKLR
ncbi:hypothetical protein IVA94_14830 [Bradyrhizobium sp. 156]|uniref:hypothetical protein n=1 Tax=Bradyrhizobium sp. 156 TaxID=2782630 RepID=UPI001FFADEDD|nr:hypothetical protein [Bradyrhizobium sp. 156]MCK1322143.1 hypothetical protein [Bradyrhizobium sp. 156]